MYALPEVRCWLCGRIIDLDIDDARHPDHLEVDHVYPIADHPEHAADPAGFRPAHKSCNARRGRGTTAPGLGSPSEDWEGMALSRTRSHRPDAARRRGEEWDEDWTERPADGPSTEVGEDQGARRPPQHRSAYETTEGEPAPALDPDEAYWARVRGPEW